MKSRQLSLLTLLLVAAALFTPSTASASHFRFGNLSWAPTPTSGQVMFTFLGSFRRDAYGGSGSDGRAITGDIITESTGPTNLNFGDGNFTPTLRFRVTAYSVSENWILGEALNPSTNNAGVLHTYAGAGPYTAQVNNCCRLSSGLNNRGNAGYRLATTVYPTGTNSSPVSSIFPIVFVPRAASSGSTSSFFMPAVDPNGDNVTYRLATDAEAGASGQVPGLTVNSTTGEVTWDNFSLNGTNYWTTQIIIEDRDGAGNVMTQNPVDFLLKIGTPTGNPPSIVINPSAATTVVINNNVSFDVTGSDIDANAVVTLNVAGLPSGATLTPTLPTSGASGISTSFSWTPVSGQAGSYVVTFSATDENGQQVIASKTINVINNQPPVADAGDDQTVECTGATTSVTLDGSGSTDPDNNTLLYEWREGATVLGTTASITVHPTLGTHTYTLTVDDQNGGTNSDNVVVNVVDGTAPTISVSLSPSSLWAPNHTLRDIAATVTVHDNCSSNLTWVLTSITSNEADNGLGDGDTPNDIQNATTGTPDAAFKLRSERSGRGTGRVYTVTYTVNDGNGNSAVGSATVTVATSNGKMIVTPAAIEGLAITGNQPNPFTQSTTINYMLPSQSDVSLTIYNADGQVVRTLVEGTRNAGAQSATWDGLDKDGRPVASGVYFCQLRAGDVIVLSTMTRTR
jgi:hypothetical protein